MAPGTQNPDFDSEPWCTEDQPAPEVVVVQADVDDAPPSE